MPYLTSNEDAGSNELYNKALTAAAIITFSAAAGQSIGKNIGKKFSKKSSKQVAENALKKKANPTQVFERFYENTGIKMPKDKGLLGEIKNHYNTKEAEQYMYKNNKFKRSEGNAVQNFIHNYGPTESGPKWLRKGDPNLKKMNERISGISELTDEEFQNRMKQYKDFNNFLNENNIHGVHPEEIAKAIESTDRDLNVDNDFFNAIWNKPGNPLKYENIKSVPKSNTSTQSTFKDGSTLFTREDMQMVNILDNNADLAIKKANNPENYNIYNDTNIPGIRNIINNSKHFNENSSIIGPRRSNPIYRDRVVKSNLNNLRNSTNTDGLTGYNDIFDITTRYKPSTEKLIGYDDMMNQIFK